MSKLFFMVGLILAILLSLLSLSAKAEKLGDSRFLFTCQIYKEGMNHFDGTKYLSMAFEITPQTKWGKRYYVARLKKGIASEGYRSSFGYSYKYFETGEPTTSKKDVYSEFALSFFERHSIRFSQKDEQVVIENADSLQLALSAEVKMIYPNREPAGMNDGYFSTFGLTTMFQHLFVQLPGDLGAPGEMSLSKGVVYNYLEDYNQFRHVEVTDNKKHEKWNLFVPSDSRIVRYKQIQGLPGQMLLRVIPLSTESNTRISGQFPRERNKSIQLIAEGASSLEPKKTISIQTDATGKFSLALNLTALVTISSDNGYSFYAEPGDDFSFTSNAKQDSLFFTGIGANNNQFLQAESRLEKLSQPYNIFSESTQSAWFKKADRITNAYFKLLRNYSGSLSPCFYETNYLNYYFGKINKKLDCMYGWSPFSPETGPLKRHYIGIDTIVKYQPFIYNHQFNKYLENDFLMQFEKLRDFEYIHNYKSPKIPSDREMIRLASLSYSGKVFGDFLEYMAPHIYSSNNQDNIVALNEIVKEYFDNSSLQLGIARLEVKGIAIKPGNLFPPVRFQNMEGKTVELSEYNGKVIYLMFWRNDALALDQQWSEYQQLIRVMKVKDLVFLYVGMETDYANWKKYVEMMKLDGLNLFIDRNGEDFKNYFHGLKSRHYMLIGKTGMVINNNGPDPSVASILISQNLGSGNREEMLLGGLIFFVSILLVLGLAWLISRTRQKRKAKIDALLNRLRETELKAIKAQMNPHFLFNSLNSIQNLINQQKIEAANMYLSKFARLLRSVLQHSEKEFVPLADEIETLTLYVQLEKLRFNFDFELNVAPDLDVYNTYIPPLLLQPFIENAILHGLQPKTGDKKLVIAIQEHEKQLVCRITDNGVGRNVVQQNTRNHHGMGNKLSEERIKLLNQKNNSNFMLRIEDGDQKSGGTQVTICFANNLI